MYNDFRMGVYMKIGEVLKNQYFKIVSIILVLILAVLLIPFYKGTNLVHLIGNKIHYLSLSEERQEVYDKMKIEYMNIKSRITGTAPFNSGDESNSLGVDVSASDDYVRTFDLMKYTVEVGISPNIDHDGVDSTSIFQGGVIKVRAKLPNQGTPVLMRWEQDAWMKNVEYSNDRTEIYAEYHVPSDTSITNANQNLSFTVKVDGYKKPVTSDMQPEFEIWMEGNKPDDATSSANSVTKKDNRNTIISGKINLDARVGNENLDLMRAEVDGHEGRFETYAIAVALYQPISSFSDLRGVEYPNGPIEVDLDARYTALNLLDGSSTYSEINSTTPGSFGYLNGTFVKEHTNNTFSGNYYPSAGTKQYTSYPAGRRGGRVPNRQSVLDTGHVDINISENKINFNFDTYKVAYDAFPEATAYSSVSLVPTNTGFFLVEAFQVFMPLYDYSEDTSYDYNMKLTVNEIRCKDSAGNTVKFENGQDAIPSNNTNSVDFSSRAKGNFYESVGLSHGGNINWRDGRASALLTEEIAPSFNLYALDGPYDYAERLITWDSSLVTLKKYNNTDWVTTVFSDGADAEHILYKYGVYKTDPENGVVGINNINAATIAKFDWYDTAEEALEHGKLAGIYVKETKFGFKSYNSVRAKFTINNDVNNVGKVAALRQFAYAYAGSTTFRPTTYDAYGNITSGQSTSDIGTSVIILGLKSSLTLKTTDTDSTGGLKQAYDVQDGEIHLNIKPVLSSGKNPSDSDRFVDNIKVKVILPNGLSYHNGSANKIPSSVTVNSSGQTVIEWIYDNWQVNHSAPDYPEINFTADISASLENNASLNINSTIFTPEDLREVKTFRTSEYGVVISNLAGSKALMTVDKTLMDKGESFNITSTLGNNKC